MTNKIDRLKRNVKWLFASRSPDFIRNANQEAPNGKIGTIQWKGRKVYYRAGTSDPNIIYHVLLKNRGQGDYPIPEDIRPNTILDIGGHIGCAALNLSQRYPDAEIYTFEPVLGNFEILCRNVEGIANIHPFNIGLGESDKNLLLRSINNRNFASYSDALSEDWSGPVTEVKIRGAAVFLDSLGLDRADIIKIDTEGAEYEILNSLPESVLQNCDWITGELHGVNDFELLRFLSEWFNLGIQKDYGTYISMFQGRKKVS